MTNKRKHFWNVANIEHSANWNRAEKFLEEQALEVLQAHPKELSLFCAAMGTAGFRTIEDEPIDIKGEPYAGALLKKRTQEHVNRFHREVVDEFEQLFGCSYGPVKIYPDGKKVRDW